MKMVADSDIWSDESDHSDTDSLHFSRDSTENHVKIMTLEGMSPRIIFLGGKHIDLDLEGNLSLQCTPYSPSKIAMISCVLGF